MFHKPRETYRFKISEKGICGKKLAKTFAKLVKNILKFNKTARF